MRRRSWFDLMNDYREATLEFAASWAEGYATFVNGCGCGRSGCSRCGAGKGRRYRGGGDFLADLVRVNVDYLAQLAKLNSTYTVVAARFLDRLYSNAVRDDYYDDCDSDVRLAERAGEEAKGTLLVCNESGREVDVQIKGVDPQTGHLTRKLCDVDDAGSKRDVSFHVSREAGKPLADFELEPGAEEKLLVKLRIPNDLKPGEYYARVKVKLDGRSQHFRVLVEVLK